MQSNATVLQQIPPLLRLKCSDFVVTVVKVVLNYLLNNFRGYREVFLILCPHWGEKWGGQIFKAPLSVMHCS